MTSNYSAAPHLRPFGTSQIQKYASKSRMNEPGALLNSYTPVVILTFRHHAE